MFDPDNHIARSGFVLLLLIVCARAYEPARKNYDNPEASVVPSETSQLKEYKTDVGTFVQIPSGVFEMGTNGGRASEEPAHTVRITKPFQIGKYEATQAQWQALMGDNPSYFKGENLPVEQVSWEDVQQFIKKLNAKKDGYTYRLPTEAEWEYACRAGSKGDYAGNLDEMAWYKENSGNKTHPVGQKKANAWGLYDMHGNVWEWCNDWYGGDYYMVGKPGADPTGPSTGQFRAYRGGGYDVDASLLRSARRDRALPTIPTPSLGFRLVRTPSH